MVKGIIDFAFVQGACSFGAVSQKCQVTGSGVPAAVPQIVFQMIDKKN